jgi:hypothetical protein
MFPEQFFSEHSDTTALLRARIVVLIHAMPEAHQPLGTRTISVPHHFL